jgi:sialate O-acetylesterase
MNRTVIGLLLCACCAVRADVKLPSLFSDHMVLQRDMNVPLWGRADPGEKITVTIAGQSQTSVADDAGHWRVTLPPMHPAEPVQLVVSGKNSLTINDVLFGENWICSGQSNMQFTLYSTFDAPHAMAAADHPSIRFFVVERSFSDIPQDDFHAGHWEICTPKAAQNFSAVGYFFGTELQQSLKCPIGLIEVDWGGTRAEAWIPREAVENLHLPYEPQWTETMVHPRSMRRGSTQPVIGNEQEQAAGRLFNALIHPLIPYAIRGVIWYQGESNAPHPTEYADVMRTLITSWRKAWNEGDFTFLQVQLASYDVTHAIEIQADEIGGGWPRIRAAQALVADTLPNVGIAVAIDVGEPKNIHPRHKAEVGQRLALAARKIAYGQQIEYSGPTLKSLRIHGNEAVVSFNHADCLTQIGEKVEGFEIAGADGRFVQAGAVIDATRVIVTSDQIQNPTAVRYAWDDDPLCTLFNGAHLPAVPFSTK